ncbi:hypothetical protein RSF51_002057 [Yersinia enterocolitica]|uniref:Phage protein n=1 Tax=Yersinia enterocolitica TaxID=630 RepID=A0A0T7P7S5_YEREN|nr:hypothetical protein [Yersinia enterocolitica]EKN3328598.1 hypothetical protein [Yersinia enterocolitica]EKN3412592.1 hypothetical protein [Yersinia enterocolitica]EKN3496505.1 hypothetical protein [Yersinia enterocolitica]EKN3558684.1 hypothetical protein [Yersinia enterocolitica]EKN3694055.1 hypothetical protein [Yersinia enterocolitica]
MKLSLVIAALRLRCPSFEGRVSGAAEYELLLENGKMALPSAWIIPTNDTAGEQRSKTDYWQTITDGFAVVVVVNNSADQRGQKAAFDAVDDVRAELFKALLGWEPESCYDPLQYDGGNLLDMNRAHLYYQYDFSATRDITVEDTHQWDDLQQLEELEKIMVDVDFMTPDGTIEHKLNIPLNDE